MLYSLNRRFFILIYKFVYFTKTIDKFFLRFNILVSLKRVNFHFGF